MEKSILTSIKKSLGIEAEYTHFDEELIMHINSVFMILTQLGVGPEEGFEIKKLPNGVSILDGKFVISYSPNVLIFCFILTVILSLFRLILKITGLIVSAIASSTLIIMGDVSYSFVLLKPKNSDCL